MFGKILSNVVKVVTCPIDIVESIGDVIVGGDGSKQSKKQSDFPALSELRDGACKGLEDLDD
jgi:hypothetical protein